MISLRQWLWKGTFEPGTEPLPVWEEPRKEEEKDFLTQVSQSLRELQRLADLAREIETRNQAGTDAEVRRLVKSLLPVLDALDRLEECLDQSEERTPELANWAKAIEGVGLRLFKSLEKIGLSPVSCVGNEVDLSLHDVVATVATNEYPEGTVIEERQKGYYFRGKLIRDAKVVIALPS